MPIVTEAGFAEDGWRTLADTDALPDAGAVIVPAARAHAEAAAIAGRTDPVGIAVAPDAEAEAVLAAHAGAPLIAIGFAKFNDGRGFSLARRLRALGYAGRLRAVGPLIADQAPMAFACGLDEIAIPDALAARQPEARWQAVLAARGAAPAYPRGYRGGPSVFDRRRAGAQA
jgi:uncharacterized protein (DUF934 family)